MKYDDICKILPKEIGDVVNKYLNDDVIQEIRIKVGKPIILNLSYGEKILEYKTKVEDLKFMMAKISNYSLYAFEEEIKQGYITLKGGHRIGLAGECVISNGEVRTIKNISSLNIRISREVVGSSDKVMKLITNNNRVYNTLIVSPPKCGKTTILRDIAKNISNGFSRINLKGKKVAIIDERSEIAGCYNGIPQMNVGIRSDVLDNCLKTNGIIMAIRSLSPEVIICDEIGTMNEVEALSMAFNSGVNMILTVHGIDLDDVSRRKSLKELINDNILERIVVLSSKNGPGTLEKVYKIQEGGQIKCLDI